MTESLQQPPTETEDVRTFGNPPIPVKDVVDEDGNTYCQVHPERETGLRCNNCGRLMCAKCAVSTPVGYRCEQCVRQRESTFFNADLGYYARLGGVCLVLGGVGAFIADLVGWWILVFFIATAAGGIISEAALRVTKGKRGRYAGEVAAGAIVLGSVIFVLLTVLPYLNAIGGTTISPEQAQQLTEQYGAEQAQQIIAQFRQERGGTIFRILGASFVNISLWIYVGITAATVYGRFNIYGGRKR